MVEIASFVLDVVKCLAAPIGRPFKYLYNYNTNFKNLEKEVRKLKNTRGEVQVKLTAAENNVEEIKQNVKDWQKDVEKTITEAEQLIQAKENNPPCFKGLCPNCITRYKHSKKAFKLERDDIGPLLLQEEKFDGVSHPTTLLSNYEKNFDKLRDDVLKLKNARFKVQRKVEEAKNNEEEIEEDVKKWLEDADSIIVKAVELIENQSSIGTDCKARCQNSKAASELMVDVIGPLLRQEERFDKVSYSTVQLSNYEKNFDKLRDGVLKLKNARFKVQRKVEEAKNNEEEIEEDVKKWLEDVDSNIVKAEELIENQSSIGTDCKARCQNSKAASELMVDLIGPLLRQEERFDKVSYSTVQLSNYEKNFDNLRDAVLKLKNGRVKVQHKIEEAKNNVEEIEEDVKKWLEDVDSIIAKAEELIENQSSIGTDCKARCQNSRAASDLMVDNIGPLLQQEERFHRVSHPTIPKEIWLVSNEDYLAFESRNSTVNNVWAALQDDKIYMMGVYGMGGLGKTTLVQEISRKAEKDKLFDEIVFVEVTETLDVKKIQTEIADKLGVKFNNQSERANKLYQRLRNNKKILLILDNVWEDLDLTTIGIPSKGGCKIMLTTRNLDVLQKMDFTSNVKMGILKDEEAWSLFMKMAGNVVEACELNSLAKDVCKECEGLPIVICTIAKALRNKSHPSVWKVALQELKMPSPAKFIGFLEKKYVKIALSYNYLRDDELKKTFLISSLMKNNTSISNLFRHVVGLDILEGANLKMEDARDRLDKLVCELKDSCLLLDGSATGQFAMHDVIRAVAITIAYTDHHVFTERNDVENDWKDKDKLKKCTKISLPSSSIISQLRLEYLDCPNLEYFCMTDMWNASFQIPSNFFTMMPKLKVLNLFEMQQSSLSSLGLLTNLQTLCLDESRIEDVTIGKLTKLKVLSLKYSYIKELSTEIGQLIELKILDLRYCFQLKRIASNVISKLLNLEELYIKGCPIQWKVEILEEFKHSKVTTLTLVTKDDVGLTRGFFPENLKRYEISIGPWQLDPQERECTRVLKSKFNSTVSSKDVQNIKNVEFLLLTGAANVENSLYNYEMNPLFEEQVSFPDLKVLVLENINHWKIWETSSFQNLTKFTLRSCKSIKYVFLSSIAKSLQHLQELKIKYCKVLKEIVAEDEGATEIVNFVFPNITILKLEYLPQFTTFYPKKHVLKLPKLKELVVIYCDNFSSKYLSFQEKNEGEIHISKLKPLFYHNKVMFPDLKVLALLDINYRKIWDGQLQTSSFQNLTKFTLWSCDNIKYVFPFSVAKNLQKLQKLEIENCRVLEEIVAKEEGANTIVNIVFPNVTLLKLVFLPQLTTFYPGMHTLELPILKKLEVINCNKFTPKHLSFQEIDEEGETHISESKYIFLDNKVVFPDLKVLTLSNINHRNIWDSQLPTSYCQNLTKLTLMKCGNIKYVILSFMAKSLQQLQELEIEDCQVLEEIVAKEEGANTIDKFVFPNVTLLKLEHLPQLTTFYPGMHTLELPILKKLVVTYCNKFTSKHLSFQENDEEGETHISESKSLFLDNKINSDLEELELTKIKWQNRSKTLEINFNELANIPLGLLERFENLEGLKLSCYKYEELFLRGNDEKQLQITVGSSSASFQNLKVLKIFNCSQLMKLITPLMSRSLAQLREMSIEYCEMLFEIVENERDATSIEIVFDNLKTLSLINLKSLTWFCSGNYSFNFPSLKELNIEECLHMKTFSKGILSLPKLQKIKFDRKEKDLKIGGGELNTIIQQLHKKKVDSHVKELGLTFMGRDIMWIRTGEFGESLFEEIFSGFGALIELKLHELFNVQCFWTQDSQLNSIFQNLECLEVRYCHNLMTLLQSSISFENLTTLRVSYFNEMQNLMLQSSTFFENLTTLRVSYCNEMQNLMSSSIVKSLRRLEVLSIRGCERMIEVLANEGDIEKGEIVFEKLEELELYDLESLTCFSSGNYTLKFPYLVCLDARECSNMKTFFGGGLSMPRLQELNSKRVPRETLAFSESDIDAIIQQSCVTQS